jgi:hypothetical protein
MRLSYLRSIAAFRQLKNGKTFIFSFSPRIRRFRALPRSAELRFGKVRGESPVHADSEIGAPLSLMPHGYSVKAPPRIVRIRARPTICSGRHPWPVKPCFTGPACRLPVRGRTQTGIRRHLAARATKPNPRHDFASTS